jgi:hypothetical protein
MFKPKTTYPRPVTIEQYKITFGDDIYIFFINKWDRPNGNTEYMVGRDNILYDLDLDSLEVARECLKTKMYDLIDEFWKSSSKTFNDTVLNNINFRNYGINHFKDKDPE